MKSNLKKTANNAGKLLFQTGIQENLGLIVFFQLGTFRWKRALSSMTFGPECTSLDVRMNFRLFTSSSSPHYSQGGGAYLRRADLFL